MAALFSPAEENASLTFSRPKQEALLGHLINNPSFFYTCRNKIQPEWWSYDQLRLIWELHVLLYERSKVGRAATPSELQNKLDLKWHTPSEILSAKNQIKICFDKMQDFSLEALQTELTEWLKCRIYLSSMIKSQNLYNSAANGQQDPKKLSQAFEIIRQLTKDLEEATFEPEFCESMDDPEGDIRAQVVDAKSALTFGLPALNRLLLPEGGGKGCLMQGDMTILLAPTNVGKTTAMVTVAALNIWEGKDVLLITHEGRIGDIKLKIWQSMMGQTRQALMEGLTNQEFREALKIVKEKVLAHLEFLPLNQAGMTVEEVESIIRRRQERWQITHMGKGFDLIVDDYAAKLTTEKAKGGQFALRQIHEIVYNYFSQIALEHKLHVLTAIQTNREGSKINSRKSGQRGEEHRLLGMEDVSEAWGPMTTATNVISINRPPEAQANNIVIYLLCKSRSSEVDWAVACKSNFACAQSHSPDAPATWYRGSSTMSSKIENLLEGYKGTEIPAEAVAIAENEVLAGARA